MDLKVYCLWWDWIRNRSIEVCLWLSYLDNRVFHEWYFLYFMKLVIVNSFENWCFVQYSLAVRPESFLSLMVVAQFYGQIRNDASFVSTINQLTWKMWKVCSTTLLREPWITTYDLGITIMYIQVKREFIQTLRCVENVKKYRITMPSGSRTDNVFFVKTLIFTVYILIYL